MYNVDQNVTALLATVKNAEQHLIKRLYAFSGDVMDPDNPD